VSRPARQRATGRCECGALVQFARYPDSPWEFAWTCARDPPHRGVVSWAHANPPPAFDGPTAPDLKVGAPVQLPLFPCSTNPSA